MAQIKLIVNADTSKASKGIENLSNQVKALETSLGKLGVSKISDTSFNAVSQSAQGTATNIDALRKNFANLLTQIKTLQNQYPEKVFDNVKASATQCLTDVNTLTKAYKNNAISADDLKAKTSTLSKNYKKLSADVAELKLNNEKLATSNPFETNIGNTIARLQTQFQSLLSTIKNAEQYYPKGTFDQITASVNANTTSLQGLNTEYKNTTTLSETSQKQLNNLSTAVLENKAAFATAKNSAENYHGTLRDMVSGFLKWQLAATLVMKPLQALQNAIQSINETLVETEKVVVSIQRVLDETVASGEISSELYKIAENLGQTFDNVQEIAQNFAKAGLSWEDTLDATTAAVLALNVAELTAEESSEGLIAIMQQFNYEASELTYVIDVLNKAADKSAVDTADLLVALQKTGSYASAANVSLEETVALISAMSEATAASGSNIGNALKSLFSYTSKDSALSTFASLSDEMNAVVQQYKVGAASLMDIWKQLSVEMQSLNGEQATLLEQWASDSGIETELGSALGDIYDDLAGVYDTAGVYRKNYFIALLNNFEEVEEVMGELSDAAGYTAEEQAKYMDTYEAKANALQSQWEEFANSEQGLLGLKKLGLDVASALLTVVDTLGGIRTMALALISVLWVLFGDKIISAVKKFGSAIKSIGTAFTTAAKGASTFQAALGIVGIALTVVSTIYGVVTSAIGAYNEKQEEARQAALDAWTAVEDETSQLLSLYQRYQDLASVTEKTTEQQEEFANVQANIVDLLGEHAIQLAGLTEGTEEYRQKLEETTKEALRGYALIAQAAANAAKEEFNSLSFSNSFKYLTGREHDATAINGAYKQTEYADIMRAAIASGLFDIETSSENRFWEKGARYDYATLKLSDNVFEQASQLQEFAQWLQDVGYGESDIFNEIVAAWQERTDAIDDLLTPIVSSEYGNYILHNGLVDSQADIDAIVQNIMDATGATEEWRDDIEALVREQGGLDDAIGETNDKLDDQIKKIEYLGDSIDALVDGLKAMREAEEEAEDLEEKRLAIIEAQQALEEKRLDVLEKQKAVLEAQKALEEARNNRSVWRYNEATGAYEWVADESAIKDAEDEVAAAQEDYADAQQDVADALQDIQDAIDAYSKYVEEQAWNKVISELESGSATNESILNILDEWKATADEVSGTETAWYQKIIDAIYDLSGVDITDNSTPAEDSGESGGETASDNTLSSRLEQAAKASREGNNEPMLALLKEAGLDFDETAKRLVALYLQGNTAPLTNALEKSGAFDGGGVANGLGYLRKATSEPEAVNNPELTSKILTPTSNEEFDRYVKDMGLLFNLAREYGSLEKPVMQSTMSRITNTNDNHSINIGGISIGADALHKPLIELLRTGTLVPRRT